MYSMCDVRDVEYDSDTNTYFYIVYIYLVLLELMMQLSHCRWQHIVEK